MNTDLLVETEKLTRSWAQHDGPWLQNYLVAGVEDPRVNLQSILSRHFLIRALVDDRLDAFMVQEYRFAAVMDWLNRVVTQAGDEEGGRAILHALRKRSDNAEGLEIPAYVLQIFASLPARVGATVVNNYIESFLLAAASSEDTHPVNPVLNSFSALWHEVLAAQFPPEQPNSRTAGSTHVPADTTAPEQLIRPKLSLLEPACGSANDYRFLHSYGLARLVTYTGFDLCSKNIDNARSLFPNVRFECDNIFEISAPAKSFDLCMAHDIFEHLSLTGLEQAIREVCRVTRQGLCLGFFQMDERAEHIVRPTHEYHWNLLSLARVRELFARYGFSGQAIHIGSFLAHHTGCHQTHNPNAYTFILQAE